MRALKRRIVNSSMLGMLALVATAGASSAGIVSYSVSTGPATPNWGPVILQLPKFNSGGLVSATISLDGSVFGSIRTANTGVLQPTVTKNSANANVFVTNGTNCTSANVCKDWVLHFAAAKPANQFDLITTTLGAKVNAIAGPDAHVFATLPGVTFTNESYQTGPAYDPDAYSFTRAFHTNTAQTRATVFLEAATPTSAGGSGATAWKVVIANPSFPTNDEPNGIDGINFQSDPCDLNFSNSGCNLSFGSGTYLVGKTHAGLSDTDNDFKVYTNPIDLLYFTGSGTFNLTANASGNSSSVGGANLSFNPKANAGADITVTYVFVPEPASIALLGSGLLLAGFSFRRRSKPTAPQTG